jgi:hypothetical protein
MRGESRSRRRRHVPSQRIIDHAGAFRFCTHKNEASRAATVRERPTSPSLASRQALEFRKLGAHNRSFLE